MRQNQPHDVAIIGGGPAGAAAGIQLAKSGLRVILLEKEKFPRFCIGESLLPLGNELLRELGIWDKLELAGFQRKYGAEFCTGDKSRLRRFWFGQHLPASCEYTYQVDRAEFDLLLLNQAREQGCIVHETTQVLRLNEEKNDPATLFCKGPQGEFELKSRWVIDASGRSSFVGTQAGLRRRSTQKTKRVALYTHFEGAFRNSGKAEGHITIVRLAKGWFWMIPLARNRTSVGLVLPASDARTSKDRTLETIFQEAVTSSPEVRDRLHDAKQLTPLRATGDYSWKYARFASQRTILTGDAAGFVDPIFSSGVMLALKSGIRAAALIVQAEKRRRPLTGWECFFYTREITQGMNRYARLIGAFYHDAGFEVFMNPSPFLKIPQSIARLVGGDTQPGILNRFRMRVFLILCRVQRLIALAPAIPLFKK